MWRLIPTGKMHSSLRPFVFWVSCFFSLCTVFSRENQSTSALSRKPLIIPKLKGPVTLDGLSDEKAWDEIDPLSMTMLFPTPGKPPSERTEIRIAHDGRKPKRVWISRSA
jgi:hypothetical protein